jgi:hypothetical protein
MRQKDIGREGEHERETREEDKESLRHIKLNVELSTNRERERREGEREIK